MKSKLLKTLLMGSIILGANLMTSCGDSKPSQSTNKPTTNASTSIDDSDPYVVKLEIVTMPAKTTYLEGEVFDPKGIVLKATWSHGIDEDVRYNDGITYDKTPITAETKSIKVTYEGISVDVPITISVIGVTSIEITKPLSTLAYPAGDKFNLNGLEVTAKFEDGTAKIINAYEVKIDGKDVTDAIKGEGVVLEKGKHTVKITYKGQSVSFEIEAYNGYRIEAENIKNADEVKESDKNYLQRVKYNGIQLGAMLYSSGQKPEAINASGQGYLGEIKKGNAFDIHIWSEVERKADIIMTAASGVIKVDSGQPWRPLETWDIQLNQMISATANGKKVEIADDVILPGFVTEPNEDGTYTYNLFAWVNFIDVAFGEMNLLKGDNVISIELIGDMAFTGEKTRGAGTVNIDKFEVRFKD